MFGSHLSKSLNFLSCCLLEHHKFSTMSSFSITPSFFTNPSIELFPYDLHNSTIGTSLVELNQAPLITSSPNISVMDEAPPPCTIFVSLLK